MKETEDDSLISTKNIQDIETGCESEQEISFTDKKQEIETDPYTLHSNSMKSREKKKSEVLRYLALSYMTEVMYISNLAEERSKNGQTSFNYTHEYWSPWFIEKTSGDPVKEYFMLIGLEKYMQRKGYETAVSRPYRVASEEKYFLHINWSRANKFMIFQNMGCENIKIYLILKWLSVCFCLVFIFFLILLLLKINFFS